MPAGPGQRNGVPARRGPTFRSFGGLPEHEDVASGATRSKVKVSDVPQLLALWHPRLNQTPPEATATGSTSKAWWACPEGPGPASHRHQYFLFEPATTCSGPVWLRSVSHCRAASGSSAATLLVTLTRKPRQ